MIIISPEELYINDGSEIENDLAYRNACQAFIELASNFDDAWNNRDAESLLDLFSENADFRFYSGLLARGKRIIARCYKKTIFPSLPDGLKHITSLGKLRLVSDDIAVVDAKADLLFESQNGSQKIMEKRVFIDVIMKIQNGKWLFNAVRIMVPIKINLNEMIQKSNLQ